MTIKPALELRQIARVFGSGHTALQIFRNLSLVVRPGEIVGLIGQSGAGKSSLLHIAGLLEQPTDGEVVIAGQNCVAMDDRTKTAVRRVGIGFVYQFHHLLPEFSALENVVIPQLIAGTPRVAAEKRGHELLERMRLSHRAEPSPRGTVGW